AYRPASTYLRYLQEATKGHKAYYRLYDEVQSYKRGYRHKTRQHTYVSNDLYQQKVIMTHDSDSDTASQRDTIRKLEGEANYKSWLTQIRLHLGCRGLWEVANGEELWPGQEEPKEVAHWYTKAKKASYIILLSLKEGPLEHVDSMPVADPKAILNTLEQLYGTRGDAARFYQFKELVTTTLEGCSSVTAYIDTLKLHFKWLGELDGRLPEWVLISLILFSNANGNSQTE
ncbi:hypothetical protein GP486_008206, partial [Trichoglossum hirsutum]